jgi:hypothetical protein
MADALQFGHLRAVVEGLALGAQLRGQLIGLLILVGHKTLQPRMDLARLTPQPKMITAKNAENAETEKLLCVFFAFFAAKSSQAEQTFMDSSTDEHG